VAAMVEI